ncbi:MAG: hypothetical protein ACTSSO_01270, partial [Candidatus Hodarchaeales archaeon]
LSSEKLSSLTFSPELRKIELRDLESYIEDSISSLERNLEILDGDKEKIINSPEFEKMGKIYLEASDRLSAFHLAEKMGGTESTFEIEGFIPKSRIRNFDKEMKEVFGNRILISKKRRSRIKKKPSNSTTI